MEQKPHHDSSIKNVHNDPVQNKSQSNATTNFPMHSSLFCAVYVPYLLILLWHSCEFFWFREDKKTLTHIEMPGTDRILIIHH